MTSGGLNKLKVYAALGVPEVWFWRGGLTMYVLEGNGFVETESSRLLPGVDLKLLVSHLDEPEDIVARRAYRTALKSDLA